MVRQTITAVTLSLFLTAPVWAGERRTNEVDALAKAKEKLTQAELGAGKPAQALSAQRQRQQVQELLDQLEAGRNVDPAAVDRVLRQAEHPY